MITIKIFVSAVLLLLPAPFPQVPDTAPTAAVDVKLSRYAFSPERIEVRQGEPVQLNFSSADVAHGIEIPALGLRVQVPAGQITGVRLMPKFAGTFDIACSKYCGVGHGRMKAVLVVQPAGPRR